MQKAEGKIKRLAGMVNVGSKKKTRRLAKAQALVKLKREVLARIKEGRVFKGDVCANARIAAIMAAKKTADLIPLCHPLQLTEVKISFNFVPEGMQIISRVEARERTGVEIEALVACSIAALTVYDMCKMYAREAEITEIMLLEKSGGRSGTFKRIKRS